MHVSFLSLKKKFLSRALSSTPTERPHKTQPLLLSSREPSMRSKMVSSRKRSRAKSQSLKQPRTAPFYFLSNKNPLSSPYSRIKDAALVTQDDFQSSTAIKLDAWATIEGTVRRGTKPDARAQVNGMLLRESSIKGMNVSWIYSAVADSDGKFSFKRVIPAKLSMGRILRHGDNGALIDSVIFDAKAGETTTIQIGGVGRPVVGHIAIPPDIAANGFAIREESVWPENTRKSQKYIFFPKQRWNISNRRRNAGNLLPFRACYRHFIPTPLATRKLGRKYHRNLHPPTRPRRRLR